MFYYADEFNLSWLPTLPAMWSPQGQQVEIPTPGQPDKYYGIGAVNYHTGETVVQFQQRKRRKEIAQLLEALLQKHPTGTVYVAWDNATTHEDDEVEEVVRGAAGRLVLLYLPTYSPWLTPIEMLWRHFRREVTHGELFATKQALLAAARNFFDRYNQNPQQVLSISGSHAAERTHPAEVACLYLVGNHDDANDLAIETFCKAWRGLSSLYDERRFRGWLYRIATNLAIDHFRHKSYEQGLWRMLNEEDIEEPSIDYNSWIEEQELVRLALAQVAPRPRKCLLLQIEGFSQEEIAAFVGLQKQSVGTYVSTARQQFRQAYRQLGSR